MSTKEKKLLKINLIASIVIIAAYLLIQLTGSKIQGNEFKDRLFYWDAAIKYNSLEPDQLTIEFDQEGFVRLGEITKKDDHIEYSLYPENPGHVMMIVLNKDTGEQLQETLLHISKRGIITDLSTDNFTNYRMNHLNMLLLCMAFTILLWASFAYCQKQIRYSYHTIFYSGLALWLTLITILLARVWLMNSDMLNVYTVIQNAATEFMLYTSLPMLIFCIALCISNISLIRHEGFRSRNALGIILSGIMLVGFLLNFALPSLMTSGSSFQMNIFNAVIGIYGSIYVFMECFLVGSIICGTLAAKHEPHYDRDYLVILGCKIRPDGSLYPLIRGRVDRAIAFYKKQLEKTGKKAIFVPSGGQGSDECISEAGAMKNYLLEQGIPEEQILVEDQSKNTLQNMRFSKALIEERTPDAKVAFSTTNFHVFRSGIISRQNDFEPDGMGSPTKWYFWPNAYMREVVGMMNYKWKSIILILIPIILFFISIQFIG